MQNTQNNYNERNEAQIIRKDGKSVIFEVMDTSFGIGKVLLNFQKYDANAPSGQRVQERISIYMDFAQFLRLANDFTVTGNGPKRLMAEKKKAESEGKTYWGTGISYGGTSAAALARQNRARNDNKPEFRSLTIAPSDRIQGYVLSASSGPGKVTKTGGFTADGAPDSRVVLAVSFADWAEVLLLTKASIEAYLGYKYEKRFEKLEQQRAEGNNHYQQRQTQQQNNQNQNRPAQQPQPQPQQQQQQYQSPEVVMVEDDFSYGPMGASSSDDMPY